MVSAGDNYSVVAVDVLASRYVQAEQSSDEPQSRRVSFVTVNHGARLLLSLVTTHINYCGRKASSVLCR